MFLKSLTLKGFKSFADSTTLEFEPGVMVVVGPNGSGKSNVVDAVAWVLGAQGPRVLRSAKMDDVIFAGTAKRPALGRAEVSLTIDNSSRRLPIDFSEVTVSRTLFRTGESEYALNGAPARLLDIQELFSDTGVGRQQHVIVGQGQLDAILRARPEDRRMVIEEAAGVLKFRRRRERSERRLEASEGNLLRIQDLLREVRRQLRPLERQAEVALRHRELSEELRSLRLFLASRELSELADRRAKLTRDQALLEERERRTVAALANLDEVVVAGEQALGAVEDDDVGPDLGRANELRERTRGLLRLVAERQKGVERVLRSGIDEEVVASLEQEAAELRAGLERTTAEVASLLPGFAELEAAEARQREEDAALADRGIPGASEEAAAALSAARIALREATRRLGTDRERLARLEERLETVRKRRGEIRALLEESTDRLAAAEEEEAAAARAASESGATEAEAEAEVGTTDAQLRGLERDLASVTARAEALRHTLDEARARAGVERLAGSDGVLGTLYDLAVIEPGYELAFEAALEDALDVVVFDAPGSARAGLEHLRTEAARGAILPVPASPRVPGGLGAHVDGSIPSGLPTGSPEGRGSADSPTASSPLHAGPGGEPLDQHVHASRSEAEPLFRSLLANVVVSAGGPEEALEIALASSGRVVVTPLGDRYSERGWRLGGARSVATRAALVEAERAVGEAANALSRGVAASERAVQRLGEARGVSRAAEALRAGIAEERRRRSREVDELQRQLPRLEAELAALESEAGELGAGVASRDEQVARDEERLAVLESHAAEARATEDEIRREREASAERRRALATLRSDLDVRAAGLEERRQLLSARLDSVELRLVGREAERAAWNQRRSRLEESATALAGLGRLLGDCAGRLEAEASALTDEADRQRGRARALGERLESARRQSAQLSRELGEIRTELQRCVMSETEVRLREEAGVEALRRDLGIEPDAIPAVPAPVLSASTTPRARVLEVERELRLLGPVNELALEELGALQERSGFLESQLEDVRHSRRELLRVIRAIDAEIVGVFEAAFADVSRHFEALFSRLFPGGEGHLCLAEPENLLDTGVEIEARPAGRNVRRLSLLSGGERSLVALAFLFAVFRSRPSPFYLMDEVEAALDDVNLHRFLDLVEDFREEAQLIIVSHQKRTMEAADALFGISMQPGGASKVVSERVRAREGSR